MPSNISAARSARSRFDLIVADRPDPVGPGKALFGETFYDRVKGALKPGGFATFQTGVPFYQPWEITEALEELARLLPAVGSLSDRGADLYRRLHGAELGVQGQGKLGTPAGIKKAAAAYKKAKLKTDYYNAEIHAAAFALPEWIKRLVPKRNRK